MCSNVLKYLKGVAWHALTMCSFDTMLACRVLFVKTQEARSQWHYLSDVAASQITIKSTDVKQLAQANNKENTKLVITGSFGRKIIDR